MDNLTHTLFGLALARTGLNSRGRWVAPVMMCAANLPDLEWRGMPWSSRADYLLHHRGVTHSVLGMAVTSLLLALAVWAAGRMKPAWFREPPRFAFALCCTVLSVYSHLLLDGLNAYGIRPWLPFDGSWYYGDMAFIVDPWMWLLLGGGIVLAAPPRGWERRAWLLLAGLTSSVVLYGANVKLIPMAAAAVWFVLLAGIFSGAAVLLRYAASSRPARVALGLWAVYLCVLFAASRASTAQARAAAPGLGAPVLDHFRTSASPMPAVPWRFQVTASDDRRVESFGVDALHGEVERHAPMATGLDDPALPSCAGTTAYLVWRVFARHPIVTREGEELVLGDARFRIIGRRDWSAQRVPLPAPPAGPPQ